MRGSEFGFVCVPVGGYFLRFGGELLAGLLYFFAGGGGFLLFVGDEGVATSE